MKKGDTIYYSPELNELFVLVSYEWTNIDLKEATFKFENPNVKDTNIDDYVFDLIMIGEL